MHLLQFYAIQIFLYGVLIVRKTEKIIKDSDTNENKRRNKYEKDKSNDIIYSVRNVTYNS